MAKPMPAIEAIRGFHDELTAIRRDLHANPEIGLEEHRTAEIVAAKLAEWGIEVHRGVGKTGVVGVLQARLGRQVDRPARRHGLPADGGADQPALSQQQAGADACLRPRRPHHHAAGRCPLSRRFAHLPGHRAFHLPAGRGGRRRCARHAGGRAVRQVSVRPGVRPAQPRPASRSGHLRSARGRSRRAVRSSTSRSRAAGRTAPARS